MNFKAILTDPPWSFTTWSDKGKGRSPDKHYPVMALEDIKKMKINLLCAPDACLFLWVIDPMLKQGIEVMEAWGFTYKTVAFTWVKENLKSPGYFTGLGYWTRANPEMCLLGTVGSPPRKAKNVQQLVVSPRREHSRKPDEIYHRIESLTDGPYLELFARHKRPGWSSWGNEVGNSDDISDTSFASMDVSDKTIFDY